MAENHNAKQRMPAILSREDRETWLSGSAEAAYGTLRQYPDSKLVAVPVSKRVNSPQNNDASCIEPLREANRSEPELQPSLL